MSEKLFVAYCTSGLGNRLRPLAAAIAYCELTGRQLRVYWDSITPNGCLTPLERLYEDSFTPISLDEMAALAGRSIGLFTEKGPGHGVQREADRFGRGQLLALAQGSAPQPSQALGLDDPNDVVIVYDNDYLHCVPRERSIAALRALRPQAGIRRKVRDQAAALGLTLDTAGVHARGTDFGLTDALAMYGNLVRERVGSQPFFLSTEDAALEQGLRAMFPGQLRSRNDRLHLTLNEGKTVWGDPDSYTISADHGVDALVDIYLLSSVTLQVYHPGSTFAEISRHLHGVLAQDDTGAGTADFMATLNAGFVARCTELLPRGNVGHDLPTEGGTAGPAHLETLPPAYTYWETLGFRIPMLERMIMVSSSTPTLHWDAARFDALVARGAAALSETEFRSLCPYPEARSQISKLQSHIRGSKVLVIGSETYWLELLCALFGAAEVTTVEYREITWDGQRSGPTPVRTITWDQYLAELPRHEQAYDMVLSYSSIEHSGLGRYGDRFLPLGDLYTFHLMARCLAPHGMCALAVPVGQDLTHFNAHRIYGPLRIRALEHVAGFKLVGLATPDAAYLAREETVDTLKDGWTLDKLTQLPMGKLRQPVLCFGHPGFSNEGFVAARQGVPATVPMATTAASLPPAPAAADPVTAQLLASRDPHTVALVATARAVGAARFVEISHVVPFGFRELEAQRLNLSVDQVLGPNPPELQGIDQCVLHVLLGCGVPQLQFVQTLRWALKNFRQVHVLEHNGDSSDWSTPAIRQEHCVDNCLNQDQLHTMARLLSTQVSQVQQLPGVQSPARNLFYTLQGGDAAIDYGDVQRFYAQVGLDAASRGRASFESWNDVYLGTAEAISLVRAQVQQLHAVRGRYTGKRLYASCGGFFCLDQMVACHGQGFSELVLFDVNPFSVALSRVVHALVKASPDRRSFLQNYLLSPVIADAVGRLEVDVRAGFDQRLLRASRVGQHYGDDLFNVLRAMLFARPVANGLQVWGMRNVGNNRIDVAARLDLHAEQEFFTDSNCLVNGNDSWLATDADYAHVRQLLTSVPVRYEVAGIDALDCAPGDLMLASNILSFVPPAVREKIQADVLAIRY